jgi:hypothetical protein
MPIEKQIVYVKLLGTLNLKIDCLLENKKRRHIGLATVEEGAGCLGC